MPVVMFVLSLTMLLGFVSYATDTGMLWVIRTRLQHSVDAAALAAAQELPSSTAARTVACDLIGHNQVEGMSGADCGAKADVTFPTAHKVTVTTSRTVEPIFGTVVGFEPVEVFATATAQIGSLGSTCLFPFFLTEEEFNSTTLFNEVIFTDTTSTGDAIDVASGSGPNGVRGAMEPGACDADPPKSILGEVDQGIDVKPGDLTQFRQGWDTIATNATAPSSACPSVDVSSYLSLDAAGEYEFNSGITTATCPRLIIVPVVRMTADKAGDIVGFVPFYFGRHCNPNSGSTCDDPEVGPLNKGDFWGYIVRLDFAGADYTAYNPDMGTKIVALAE